MSSVTSKLKPNSFIEVMLNLGEMAVPLEKLPSLFVSRNTLNVTLTLSGFATNSIEEIESFSTSKTNGETFISALDTSIVQLSLYRPRLKSPDSPTGLLHCSPLESVAMTSNPSAPVIPGEHPSSLPIPGQPTVVRRIPLLSQINNELYPSFALEVIRTAVGDISYQIKTNDIGIEWVRIPAYDKISTLNDGTVYNTYWNKFKRVSIGDIRGENISPGSILIVGPTFEGTNIVPTPVGALYPHDIQANLVKTIIDGTVITRPDYFLFVELDILRRHRLTL